MFTNKDWKNHRRELIELDRIKRSRKPKKVLGESVKNNPPAEEVVGANATGGAINHEHA